MEGSGSELNITKHNFKTIIHMENLYLNRKPVLMVTTNEVTALKKINPQSKQTKYSFKSEKNKKKYSDIAILLDKIINHIR